LTIPKLCNYDFNTIYVKIFEMETKFPVLLFPDQNHRQRHLFKWRCSKVEGEAEEVLVMAFEVLKSWPTLDIIPAEEPGTSSRRWWTLQSLKRTHITCCIHSTNINSNINNNRALFTPSTHVLEQEPEVHLKPYRKWHIMTHQTGIQSISKRNETRHELKDWSEVSTVLLQNEDLKDQRHNLATTAADPNYNDRNNNNNNNNNSNSSNNPSENQINF